MTDSEFEKMNHKEQYEDLDEFQNAKRIVKHKRIERKIRKKRKKVNNLKAFIRFILLVAIIFVTYHFSNFQVGIFQKIHLKILIVKTWKS